MKFSPTTLSFYPSEIAYANLPGDLIDVGQSEFEAAIAARATGASLGALNGVLVITPAPAIPTKTVLELDIEKYKRRADAKPLLMAEMAAMNIGRLKDLTWTTAQLVNLMSDPEIKSLISHMETLSFELAIGVINGLTNPIVTPEIKATWVSKLVAKL